MRPKAIVLLAVAAALALTLTGGLVPAAEPVLENDLLELKGPVAPLTGEIHLSLGTLQVGGLYYVDRTFEVMFPPYDTVTGEDVEELLGQTIVMAANDDKQVGHLDYMLGDEIEYLRFELKEDATVYVCMDRRGERDYEAGIEGWWPYWLDDLGFERTGMILETTDNDMGYFILFRADFEAGEEVHLGGNAADTGGSSSYLTIVVRR